MKLYEKGQDRIDTELNIIKIMKSVRDMKVLLKSSLMDKEAKFQIKHSRKNLIDIDETISSEEYETGRPNDDISFNDIKDMQKNPEKDKRTADPKIIRRILTRNMISHKKNKSKEKPKFSLGVKHKFANLAILKFGKINYKNLSREMAAIIITRWAKRRLIHMGFKAPP